MARVRKRDGFHPLNLEHKPVRFSVFRQQIVKHTADIVQSKYCDISHARRFFHQSRHATNRFTETAAVHR